MDKMPLISIDATLFWQMINFIILLFVFKKYFKKPLAEIMKKRLDIIKENLESAKTANQAAQLLNKEAQDELLQAKAAATSMINQATSRANIEEDRILADAKMHGHKIIEQAQEEAKKIKKNAQESIVFEARQLSIDLAEKMLKEKIDSKIETALIDEFIAKVGEE